jgi:hypothetical protein
MKTGTKVRYQTNLKQALDHLQENAPDKVDGTVVEVLDAERVKVRFNLEGRQVTVEKRIDQLEIV